MAHALCDELQSAQPFNFQLQNMGFLYIYITLRFEISTLGWIEHGFHICSRCGGVGGSVGRERVEIKWTGGNTLLLGTWLFPFVMDTVLPNHSDFNYCLWACLYTYISSFRLRHYGWIERVLHICVNCREIGGRVEIEIGEAKWRGGDEVFIYKWLIPFVMNHEVFNLKSFNHTHFKIWNDSTTL